MTRRASFLTTSLLRMLSRSQIAARKGWAFALLGALAIAHMDRGGVMVASRQRSADAGIHSSAEQDDRAGLL